MAVLYRSAPCWKVRLRPLRARRTFGDPVSSTHRWSRYDPDLDVIETDVTGVDATTVEIIDAIFDELEALAGEHPGRYVLACWKNTTIATQSVADYYGTRTTRLLTVVRAVVRYGASDTLTRGMVRSQAIKHLSQGMRSNLYDSRDEAIAAIDALRGKKP